MKNIKYLIAAAAAPMAFMAAAPAYAQVPTVDPGSIAQTVKVVQNGIQQVQQMKAQVEQMTSMAKTIGQNGPLSMVKDTLVNAGLDFLDLNNSPLAPYRAAMPGILDALPNADIANAVMGGKSAAESLAKAARTNISSGREFALKAFYKPGTATTEEIQQRQGLREAAVRDSVTSGYAMAVYTKNNLADPDNGVEKRMKALSEAVSKAQDLRGDVQSNSAIALAQLQQLTVQNTLLAQILEVSSTSSMASLTTGDR